jgi:hypothetical protein
VSIAADNNLVAMVIILTAAVATILAVALNVLKKKL